MAQLWFSFGSVVGGMIFPGPVQLWFSCGSVWLWFDVCGSVWFICGLAWCGIVSIRFRFGSAWCGMILYGSAQVQLWFRYWWYDLYVVQIWFSFSCVACWFTGQPLGLACRVYYTNEGLHCGSSRRLQKEQHQCYTVATCVA